MQIVHPMGQSSQWILETHFIQTRSQGENFGIHHPRLCVRTVNRCTFHIKSYRRRFYLLSSTTAPLFQRHLQARSMNHSLSSRFHTPHSTVFSAEWGVSFWPWLLSLQSVSSLICRKGKDSREDSPVSVVPEPSLSHPTPECFLPLTRSNLTQVSVPEPLFRVFIASNFNLSHSSCSR